MGTDGKLIEENGCDWRYREWRSNLAEYGEIRCDRGLNFFLAYLLCPALFAYGLWITITASTVLNPHKIIKTMDKYSITSLADSEFPLLLGTPAVFLGLMLIAIALRYFFRARYILSNGKRVYVSRPFTVRLMEVFTILCLLVSIFTGINQE